MTLKRGSDAFEGEMIPSCESRREASSVNLKLDISTMKRTEFSLHVYISGTSEGLGGVQRKR